MLYLVGLGLSDETDITVKGLEVVKKASRVYLEAYTSILLVDQPTLVRPPKNTRALRHTNCSAGKLLWPLNNNRGPRNGRVQQR